MFEDRSESGVTARRVLFAALVLLTIAALLALAGRALSAGGFGPTDALLLALFALTTPWLVVGFWNAVIGFAIMRFARDPIAVVVPSVRRLRADGAIAASTAIAMFVRNEPPDRVIRNLDAMLREIEAAGATGRFHLYVLSDTSRDDIAEQEDAGFGPSPNNGRAAFPSPIAGATTTPGSRPETSGISASGGATGMSLP